MKRKELINLLLNEGFTHKTLSVFNDKQLNDLSERILSEQNIKGSVVVNKNTQPSEVKKLTDNGINVEIKEDHEDDENYEINQTEVNEWVNKLTIENYHSFTSKKDIMEMIDKNLKKHQNMGQR